MQIEIELLLFANVLVYSSIIVGLVQWRRRPVSGPVDLNAMFRQLEPALERRFPDLPEGYTIREGLSRARSLGLDLRWEKIENALEGYEAYRYGDGSLPSSAQPELEKLVRRLTSW